MGLTDDAKKAIEEAIAIVRADKVHEYIRRSSKPADPTPTPAPAPAPAPTPDPTVPAPPPRPTDPPAPSPDGPKRSAWWGDVLADD